MNIREKMTVTAAAIVAATAMSSQAADPGAPTQYRFKPATPYQVELSKWFDAERAQAGGAPPVPFPVPAPSPSKRVVTPATPHQAAENEWLTKERNETDGNTAPIAFVAPTGNTNVAGR